MMWKYLESGKPSKAVSAALSGSQSNVAVKWSSEGPVRMLVDGELVATLPPGNNSDVFRVEGEQMELKGDAVFSAWVRIGEINVFEPIDDREIPALGPPSNILQQMHREFRRSMGVIREAFEADTGWPGYEMDDEEPVLFEEELAVKAKEEREAAAKAEREKAKAEGRAEAEAAAKAAQAEQPVVEDE